MNYDNPIQFLLDQGVLEWDEDDEGRPCVRMAEWAIQETFDMVAVAEEHDAPAFVFARATGVPYAKAREIVAIVQQVRARR